MVSRAEQLRAMREANYVAAQKAERAKPVTEKRVVTKVVVTKVVDSAVTKVDKPLRKSKKMGRPPKGGAPMSDAERMRAYRKRKSAEPREGGARGT